MPITMLILPQTLATWLALVKADYFVGRFGLIAFCFLLFGDGKEDYHVFSEDLVLVRMGVIVSFLLLLVVVCITEMDDEE